MSSVALVPGQAVIGVAVLGAAFVAFVFAILLASMVSAAYHLTVRRRRARQLLRSLDHHLETHVRNDQELAEGWGRLYAAVQDDLDWGEAS